MWYYGTELRSDEEFNILRLICGLFFIPAYLRKVFRPRGARILQGREFRPPAVWMYTACVIESFLAFGLIFAIFPMYAAQSPASIFWSPVSRCGR